MNNAITEKSSEYCTAQFIQRHESVRTCSVIFVVSENVSHKQISVLSIHVNVVNRNVAFRNTADLHHYHRVETQDF